LRVRPAISVVVPVYNEEESVLLLSQHIRNACEPLGKPFDHWGIWHLVANRPSGAPEAAQEYGRRFGCEEGLHDAKWWLGFAKARIAQIKAWSRMSALFALALLVMTSLGSRLLLSPSQGTPMWLRRVVSRRRGRCELSLVGVIVSLLRHDNTFYEDLCPHHKLTIEAT
jgi:glycosyltransferase involved in cell wall biosynthesis